MVYVQLKNGKTARLPFEKLSEADRLFIEAEMAKGITDDLLEDLPAVRQKTAAQPPTNRSQASDQNARMLAATRESWNNLMRINQHLFDQNFETPSEQYRAFSLGYSKIPLDGVDPILLKHVLRSVIALRGDDSQRFDLERAFARVAEFARILGH